MHHEYNCYLGKRSNNEPGKLLLTFPAAATAASIRSLASLGTVDKNPILGGSWVG